MTLENQDIEAIAHRVVELLESPPRKLLTAAEVAQLLAVDLDFVYVHQEELGVVALPGKGRRPALRFDRDTLLERLDRRRAGARAEARPTSASRPAGARRDLGRRAAPLRTAERDIAATAAVVRSGRGRLDGIA